MSGCNGGLYHFVLAASLWRCKVMQEMKYTHIPINIECY